MENALCIEDGAVYTAISFAHQLPDEFDRKRRLLQCPECGGPAFFRNTSRNGRTPCFGARPHSDGCNFSAYDQSRLIYDTGDNYDIPGSSIIVDFGYGSPMQTAAVWDMGAKNSLNDFGLQRPDFSIHRRLSSLLCLLVESPAFRNSDRFIQVHGHAGIPSREFFVPLLAVTAQHIGQQRGYWGLISDAKLTGNTLWLNSGKRDTISFGLDTRFIDDFVQRFHLNELEDLAGAMILVIGTPSIAKNGKLFCVIKDIEFMTLKLT